MATRSLPRSITPLSSHEEREFEDGEHKARPLESVRGEDVYVIQSLDGEPNQSPNDKLCRLLFFLATLKGERGSPDYGGGSLFGVRSQGRQTKSRDPVTSRYIAQLFEAMGTDRVVTLEVHNIVAFQNAFRCQTIHLDTRRLFIQHLDETLESESISRGFTGPGRSKASPAVSRVPGETTAPSRFRRIY